MEVVLISALKPVLFWRVSNVPVLGLNSSMHSSCHGAVLRSDVMWSTCPCPGSKAVFPKSIEFASRMFWDAYSKNLWVYLNTYFLFPERELSLKKHENIHSSSPLQFWPVLSEPLIPSFFCWKLNSAFPALSYVRLHDLQAICFYLVVLLSHEFAAYFP